jgi:hypothetical protein
MAMKRYFWNLLIAIDQLGNSLLAGSPDETISSRAGKAVQRGNPLAVFLCNVLHLFDRNHCVKSIESDE